MISRLAPQSLADSEELAGTWTFDSSDEAGEEYRFAFAGMTAQSLVSVLWFHFTGIRSNILMQPSNRSDVLADVRIEQQTS